jgi:diacylglycerol kinase (ATP)
MQNNPKQSSHFKSTGGGIQRIFCALRYSWQGLSAAFRHESAFRQELLLIAATAPLLLLPGLTLGDRALLIGANLLILLVELLNSAIEATVDLVTQQENELAGRAKDFGSAAVLVAMLIWGLIWGVLIIPVL